MRHIALRCTELRCAALLCASQCLASICCTMLCYSQRRCTTRPYAAPHCSILRGVSCWDCNDFYIGRAKRRLYDRKTDHLLCCASLCYAVLRYAMLRYITL